MNEFAFIAESNGIELSALRRIVIELWGDAVSHVDRKCFERQP
jgi:hypothetical protein